MSEINAISGQVLDSALKVHRALGPGLLEKVHEICLRRELEKRGLCVRTQVKLPVFYEGIRIDAGYRLDLLVAEQLIVEVKAVDQLLPVHSAQLLSYLRLRGKRVGLLINFNVSRLVDGVKRVVNSPEQSRVKSTAAPP